MFKWVGKGIKKTGNVAIEWANVSLLQKIFYMMRDVMHKLFGISSDDLPDETFAQAMKRLGLTEEQLQKRRKIFQIQLGIYSLGAIAVTIYMAFLLSAGHWISVWSCAVIIIFLAVNALKCHFWLFQIKQRKLGCTIKEWLNSSSMQESK